LLWLAASAGALCLRGSGCRNLALPGVYEQALPFSQLSPDLLFAELDAHNSLKSGESQEEPVSFLLQRCHRDHGQNGGPVVVTHRTVYRADYFDVPDQNPAYKSGVGFKKTLKRRCVQRD